MIDRIYCEDCFETMTRMPDGYCDVVMTSPFYNTNKKAGKNRTLKNTSVKSGQYDYVRYDTHVDNMTNDEYSDFTVRLFKEFERILKHNGCVLYNINYGSENTEGMFLAIAEVLKRTDFTLADCIAWKKRTALPNSCSPNKLTRLIEFVFVFCRREEIKTFVCNKQITSYRKTGQAAYENIYNFIEAANNDEPCPYNKATYSTELCEKLLKLYSPPRDSFTTRSWEAAQQRKRVRRYRFTTSVLKSRKIRCGGRMIVLARNPSRSSRKTFWNYLHRG